MYIREQFKRARGVIPEFVPSTDDGVINSVRINSTTLCGFTTGEFGRMFSVTLECTTGIIYLIPDSTVLTTTNSFALIENTRLDLQIDNYLSVLGDSTTAALQGIVWSDG